jgi:hypothetical protein
MFNQINLQKINTSMPLFFSRATFSVKGDSPEISSINPFLSQAAEANNLGVSEPVLPANKQPSSEWPTLRLQSFLLGGPTAVTLMKGLLWSHRGKFFSR